MEKTSLKKLHTEKAAHKKEADRAVNQFSKTEKDIRATSDKVGAVRSELSDVMPRIREARNKVLDSAKSAGDQDAKSVQAREKATSTHQKSVDAIERRTKDEKQKADSVKPKDSRIRDGREISKALGDASTDLRNISKQESLTIAEARKRRGELSARVKDSVTKNRR